jgi:squalene-hopene/tetraprenyl-beta-curcumene cyclase
VPDADDTGGALATLANLGRYDTEPVPPDADSDELRREPDTEAGRRNERLAEAMRAGNRWLEGLRNRDGGIPTFCRGWGKLPFDRSSPDITAHLVRARAEASINGATEPGNPKSLTYLRAQQRPDGAWSALWFGNQHFAEENNLTYGTSRCVLALARRLEILPENGSESSAIARTMMDAGVGWLLDAQDDAGGWGGGPGTPASIEETALAVEALAAVLELWARRSAWPAWRWVGINPAEYLERAGAAAENGAGWLIEQTQHGTAFEPKPIGFYFAKLWYFERLYPVIWTVAALERTGAWRQQQTVAETATSSTADTSEPGASEPEG